MTLNRSVGGGGAEQYLLTILFAAGAVRFEKKKNYTKEYVARHFSQGV